MKSASNELRFLLLKARNPNNFRALKELLEVSLEDMRFPLMAVYDYKGERIMTCCALPINSDTILYGYDFFFPHSLAVRVMEVSPSIQTT